MRTHRLAASALLLGGLALAGCSADPDPDPGTSSGGGGSDAGGGGSGGAGPSGAIDGVVQRYDYAFDLEAATFRSTLTVDVAPPGGDCFDVGCRLGALGGVTWGGAPAGEVALDGAALHVCGEGVPAGPLQIAAAGAVEPGTAFGGDVGFSRSQDLAGGELTYLLSWVGGCDRFGPCDADPSRLVELHFEVTHPEGTTVLCPGARTVEGGVTRCDVEGTLAPTYSGFALAADPLWQRAPFASAAGVDLVFYEVPGGGIAASLDPASVTEFMEWVTGLLGPFPYGEELRIAGGPTYWLGFEHPANILLYEEIGGLATSYADTAMHVLMHEIVHQWAGDRTTLATAEDFVWKEATAEYLAYVFEDERRPPGEAAASREYWDTVSLQAGHYPRPTDDPPPPVHVFYGDVYGPGPMVLYVQLEALIGRPAVLAGIQAFLAEPGARSVADLRAALEQVSSADLGPYFDAWVLGQGAPEWPTFAVAAEQLAGEVTVTVTQQNASGKRYGCVVEVEVAGATETARALVDFGAAPSSEVASVTIPFLEPVTGVTLDPDHRLVARDAAAPAAPGAGKLPVWVF